MESWRKREKNITNRWIVVDRNKENEKKINGGEKKEKKKNYNQPVANPHNAWEYTIIL